MSAMDRSKPRRPVAPGDCGVIILNHNGRAHLEAGLPSVLDLRGLAGPEAVMVADNGSQDGSLEWLAERHPAVRRLALNTNLGFAEGNNRAAAAFADASWLLFLNNDTRVSPGLLREFCAVASKMAPRDTSVAQASAAVCCGARLLDWEGRRLDFDGGAASLTGHGHALGVGRRPGAAIGADHPTLFACGAALFLPRALFLELGGFAAGFFAYYEDVDLGWRLWLAGHEVRHVPRATVLHRHHGTAGALSVGRRASLHERNALATLVRNLGDEALQATLPAALALAALRAAPQPGYPALEVIRAARAWVPAAGLPLPHPDWPGWAPLAPLGLDWPDLARQREQVQRLRRRPDSEVLPRLGLPYAPVPGTATAEVWLREAVACFGLERFFGNPPPRSLRSRLAGSLMQRAGARGRHSKGRHSEVGSP